MMSKCQARWNKQAQESCHNAYLWIGLVIHEHLKALQEVTDKLPPPTEGWFNAIHTLRCHIGSTEELLAKIAAKDVRKGGK